MIKIKEFAFVGYCSRDLRKARAFYEGILGLTPGMLMEKEGMGWVEYEVGPHTLAIGAMEGDDWQPSDKGTSVALEVEDFDAAVAVLREKGVKFTTEPFTSPVCRMCLVADPDGNRVGIHQRHAQPSSNP